MEAGVTTAKSARSLGPPEAQRLDGAGVNARAGAVLGGADTVKERQTHVGLPDLGCEGSVPGSGGWRGVRRSEEKGGCELQVKDKEAA